MNLHELLLNDGAKVSFRHQPPVERLDFPALVCFEELPEGEGIIQNEAGALMLRGTLKARVRCTCDRCTAEFSKDIQIPMEIPLAKDLEDEDNPDYFLLDGDELDLDDVLETVFILNTDQSSLCKPDCKGLCDRCGKNLNEGPCSCKAELDPRLAVLEQLLEK